MTRLRILRVGLVVLVVALAGCTPQAPQGAQPPQSAGDGAGAPSALNVVLVGEPRALTMWRETTTGNVINIHELVTNALIGQDANSDPIPRLASEVPSVEKGTWKIFPDGTMETTYRLQPNARWHDGTPFTAQDVAFSWQAQVDPKTETFVRTLQVGAVDGVDTPDEKTAVLHWGTTYGFADSLIFWDFTPLPAHLLQPVYQRDVLEFNTHPYWTDPTVFVGSGPYTLARWEKGALMEFQAFDQYYLGKPRLDRIIVHIVQDDNTAVAHVLADEMDISWGGAWDRVNMQLVRDRGLGDFVFSRENYSHFYFQFKDMADSIEFARDVRLRRALAYATDKEAINEAGFDGLGQVLDSWIPPDDPRYKAAEPYIVRHPYDPRRAQQLFAEAGWSTGDDGLLRNSAGRSLTCMIRGASPKFGPVVSASWKEAGINAPIEERPEALIRDLAYRATFTCVDFSSRTLGRTTIEHLLSKNAMLPENSWAGSNRGSYMNAELDRFLDGFFAATTLDERLRHEREALRMVTTDLPLVPTTTNDRRTFQANGVTALVPKTGLDIMNSATWNSHEWDKR